MEITFEMGEKEPVIGLQVTSAKQIAKKYEYLNKMSKEYLIVISLTEAYTIIKSDIVSVGTASSVIIHAREVFTTALKRNAALVVIIHNHPSGISKPSNDDNQLTEKLISSGEILNIPVVDHIIIAQDGFYSYKDKENENEHSGV